MLPGPWKFTPGDSPWNPETRTFAWADPAFDDSRWVDMDLHADRDATDPTYGFPGSLPGWSALGYRNLTGFAWYRLRVHVAPGSPRLWIKMPDHTDDVYQVYANGKYLGQLGQFLPSGVICYRSRPLYFKLPEPNAKGEIELAIRFYMEPQVTVTGASGDPGGMHQAPALISDSVLNLMREHGFDTRIRAQVVNVFIWFLLIVAAAGAFWIYLLDRQRATFLWLALGLLCQAAILPISLVGFFTFWLPQRVQTNSTDALGIWTTVLWTLFWYDWFNLRPSRRFRNAVLACGVGALMATLLLTPLSWSPLALHISIWIRNAIEATILVLLFIPLARGMRRDRMAALLAVVPILILGYDALARASQNQIGFRQTFFALGIPVPTLDVAVALLLLVVGALSVRRFIQSQVSQKLERQSIDQEMEQARQLQQRVLVPAPVHSQNFSIESAYYPARSVGGDFFQVLSRDDGSLLVVVGDVSGKGMAAAMLVAVLVGAIRTRADETFDPAALLATLNERLLGRADSHFATCIVAHLLPNGELRLANAGHLPAYRNSEPIEQEGNLPLGLVHGAQYPIALVQLAIGDALTFLTDGVVEARNTAGQLLGFERLAQLATLPPDAIAKAAIAHGQDDDITVLRVQVTQLQGPAEPALSDTAMAAG